MYVVEYKLLKHYNDTFVQSQGFFCWGDENTSCRIFGKIIVRCFFGKVKGKGGVIALLNWEIASREKVKGALVWVI